MNVAAPLAATDRLALTAGRPWPLGATPEAGGANFAMFSEDAEAIELCLFSPDGATEIARGPLPERTGAVWHGFLAGLEPGALYGLRARGTWAPECGRRFNPAKLLLDPYARAHRGAPDPLSPLLLDGDGEPSPADSAPAMPRCVLAADPAPVPWEERPATAWENTLIYEAHVKGLTRLHPDVPPELRGTYDALASAPMLEHYRALGVTALELLPVHAAMDEPRLRRIGLTNYWGYNSFGFFALDPRFFGPAGAAGFRQTVRRLHAAGIEVILDVVYNHTAEGDQTGPTLSFRGLDNAAYYRLQPGRRRRYVNDTGTGNALDLSHPFVLRMVMDSLRHWVERMGVDGFRFDLATTLGREAQGFDPGAGLFDALRQDPVLSRVKLIAEPWDIGPGGYRLGAFPAPFAEWNDAFRDAARRFWRRDPHSAQELAGRLLGSAAVFDRAGRRAWSSVNCVACHDGFTLADLAAYAERHNHANGEGNRDGHHANFSDNCGVEGETDDAGILARRARRRRNLMATVLLSQGTPMLLAGDEVASSQGGNNNAYCQDNETSWIDWAAGDAGLLEFARRLAAFRRAHPCLRQSRFLHGEARADGEPDVSWRDFDGGPMAWRDPGLDRFCLALSDAAEAPPRAAADDAVFLAVNSSDETVEAALPPGRAWTRALDTAAPDAAPRRAAAREPVCPASIVAFAPAAG